jgi:hypothetical protein
LSRSPPASPNAGPGELAMRGKKRALELYVLETIAGSE